MARNEDLRAQGQEDLESFRHKEGRIQEFLAELRELSPESTLADARRRMHEHDKNMACNDLPGDDNPVRIFIY